MTTIATKKELQQRRGLKAICREIDDFQGELRQKLRELDLDTSTHIEISTQIYNSMHEIRQAVDKATQT
jgi:hypothetical protein